MTVDKENIIYIITGIIAIAILIYKFFTAGWSYFLELIPPIILSSLFVFIFPKEKAYRLAQYIGFGGFFLFMFIPPGFFSKHLFVYSILFIFLSVMLKKDIKVKAAGTGLDSRIKSRLKITGKSKVMKLPKRIGGFVIPAFPFFHVVSKDWKGTSKKEAIIHENVHLYYLQNGWLVVFIIGILFISAFVQKLLPKSFDINIFALFLVYLSAVFFEYVTFNKTYKIGREMGIVTRQWDRKIAYNYLFIYFIQFVIIFFVYRAFKFIGAVIKGLF